MRPADPLAVGATGAPPGVLEDGDAEDIDLARLEMWLSAHVEGFKGPATCAKFAGGQSNPTYRIASPSGSYVLRRKPFGNLLPSAHAIEREYQLIAALYPAGYPVAAPLALCDDAAVIGASFYVMELVEGTIYWDGALPDRAPEARRAIYFEMADRLAQLHALDFEAVGLGGFGRAGGYLERQVRRWTKQYRLSQTDEIPEAEKLIAWLPRSLPAERRTAIVHGDYRIDNLIFEGRGSRVKAVLDWELATLGDPLADLSYLLMNWVTPVNGRAGVKGLAGSDSGIPTLDEMITRYCGHAGIDAGVGDLDWYFAFCRFRQMGITQGIRKRFLDGNASSAQAGEMSQRVPEIAASGWDFARRAGAE